MKVVPKVQYGRKVFPVVIRTRWTPEIRRRPIDPFSSSLLE